MTGTVATATRAPAAPFTGTVELTKHHGLGNDFLVFLSERNPGAPLPAAREAALWCDRHRGIGADGLLIGFSGEAATRHELARHHDATSPDHEGGGPTSTEMSSIGMRLFNADGSIAEMSGNGVRCFGHAVAEARGLRSGSLTVTTAAGPKHLRIEPGSDMAEVLVTVEMGAAGPGPLVPAGAAAVLVAIRHGTVDMGNPHLVVEDPAPGSVDLTERGGWFETQFPEGVNVEFVRVVARDRIELTVWERGAGITAACGTGACAAVHTARGWGLVDHDVTVVMPGGEARVLLRAGHHVTLIGPSVLIGRITITRNTGAP